MIKFVINTQTALMAMVLTLNATPSKDNLISINSVPFRVTDVEYDEDNEMPSVSIFPLRDSEDKLLSAGFIVIADKE